jgi:hypothetical protein
MIYPAAIKTFVHRGAACRATNVLVNNWQRPAGGGTGGSGRRAGGRDGRQRTAAGLGDVGGGSGRLAVVMALLVVDAANVVGSVPDGWWRDRLGAARRLRDALATLADTELPEVGEPVEVVLVVEGAASGLASVEGVRVVTAPRSGDDEIVAQAELGVRAGRAVWVVTADRGLRTRVTEIGARVLGPRSVPRSL